MKSPVFLICAAGVVAMGLVLPTREAWAYRPFVSTDAAVVGRNKTEIELGLFSFLHRKHQNEVALPSLRFNYGMVERIEAVAEGQLQIYRQGEERNLELKESAVSLKGILRDGVLQRRRGPSLAAELSVLLPSTVKGERKAGLEGVGIFSWNLYDLGFHLNLGGEFDREDFALNGIWGTIVEYPFGHKLRLVGEVNGRFKHEGVPENTALIGFLWEIKGATLDFGATGGLSEPAPDWGLTTGMTFRF